MFSMAADVDKGHLHWVVYFILAKPSVDLLSHIQCTLYVDVHAVYSYSYRALSGFFGLGGGVNPFIVDHFSLPSVRLSFSSPGAKLAASGLSKLFSQAVLGRLG